MADPAAVPYLRSPVQLPRVPLPKAMQLKGRPGGDLGSVLFTEVCGGSAKPVCLPTGMLSVCLSQ